MSDLTKTVVQEVAKYIRSSPRFASAFRGKVESSESMVAAVENFSFAPQRFASKERPLTRFVLFAGPVLEILGTEVHSPTSASRKQWAQKILRKLDRVAWCTIGMLADLADDCYSFVARTDSKTLDALDFAVMLEEFLDMLQKDLGGLSSFVMRYHPAHPCQYIKTSTSPPECNPWEGST